MAGSTAIQIRNLGVGFGNKTILHHLNLDVKQGEILGLVGASGGGKSVLMRTLVGLLPKRGGQIDFVNHRKGERSWGILFQQGALFSALNARQNVQFPLREQADGYDAYGPPPGRVVRALGRERARRGDRHDDRERLCARLCP